MAKKSSARKRPAGGGDNPLLADIEKLPPKKAKYDDWLTDFERSHPQLFAWWDEIFRRWSRGDLSVKSKLPSGGDLHKWFSNHPEVKATRMFVPKFSTFRNTLAERYGKAKEKPDSQRD